MKLSIIKKMALLLVGLATVQGYAAGKFYYDPENRPDGVIYSELAANGWIPGPVGDGSSDDGFTSTDYFVRYTDLGTRPEFFEKQLISSLSYDEERKVLSFIDMKTFVKPVTRLYGLAVFGVNDKTSFYEEKKHVQYLFFMNPQDPYYRGQYFKDFLTKYAPPFEETLYLKYGYMDDDDGKCASFQSLLCQFKSTLLSENYIFLKETAGNETVELDLTNILGNISGSGYSDVVVAFRRIEYLDPLQDRYVNYTEEEVAKEKTNLDIVTYQYNVKIPVPQIYTITFLGYDGKPMNSKVVSAGEVPEAPSLTVKEDSEEFRYFAKWTPEIVPVTEDATYKAVLDSVRTHYRVTYLNFDGVEISSQLVAVDDEPVPPTISVPEDDDTYHYYVKWTPKIEDVTVDQTYRASIEKVLKDPKVVVKVENLYVGSKMKISTPTPCIELEGARLDPDDGKRILDKENNLSYIEGVDKVQNYTLEAWDWSWNQYNLDLSLRLLEDGECADDIIVKTIRYNVEKDDDFVFYVNDHKGQFFFNPNADDEIYATPWLQFHATYGAIDYAYGKSRAIIDGTSMAPVLESVNGLTAGDVHFNRDFKAGKYSTIMLPFSTEVSKLADADHASFYGISDIVKVDGKWQVQVAAVSDIEANTPYIVVSDVDLDVLIIEDNVTFNTTEGTKSSTAGDWQFVGTYEYKKWTEGDPELGRAFVIDEMGKLKKIKVGDEQYPLSAYLVDPNVRVVTFFDDKGVQVGDVVTVASGMAVSVPAEPAKREGYTFAGWFQKNAETAYDFSAAVNEDLELYGKWTVNKYEIAVAANDSKMGSVKGAGTYEYGTEVELVATAAEGYKFSNWEDDVKASATRKVKVTAAASYKANFEKIAESSSSEAATNSSSSRNDTESSSSSAKDDKSSSSSKTDAIVAAAAVPQFSLSVAGRNLQIAGARIGSAYAVLDMQGRVLATGRTASASMEIAVPRAGSYMVRVGSQTKRVNVK